MLSWSVWWSIMGSYCKCCVGLSGGLLWGVIAYVELVCLVAYNGELGLVVWNWVWEKSCDQHTIPNCNAGTSVCCL